MGRRSSTKPAPTTPDSVRAGLTAELFVTIQGSSTKPAPTTSEF
ncbi:hypothetical protein [Chroococcidiopsis sp. SAG 2025]|nr:hypothetical protein [Chroococcidiopsis sp. SAG 2025]